MSEGKKPTPAQVFGTKKAAVITEVKTKRERQRVRRHKRATYIAPQDEGKENPFADEAGGAIAGDPEAPEEVDESNDRRLRDNVPPHFGKL